MGYLNSLEHICLLYFVHLALYHHDVVDSSCHHHVNIGICYLLIGWIDEELTIDASYTNFADRTFERNVRYGKSRRSGQSCKGIGHVNAIGGEQRYINKNFCVVVSRE